MSFWTPEPDELGLSSTVADVSAIDDEEYTAILGPKCPDCRWRRGWHRPEIKIANVAACPQWVPGAETGAHLPPEPTAPATDTPPN